MFGPDQPVILQLIEIPVGKAMKALEGVAMELDDCAFPLLKSMVLTAKQKSASRMPTGPFSSAPAPAVPA